MGDDRTRTNNFANNNVNEEFSQEKCPSWNSNDGTSQLFFLFGTEKLYIPYPTALITLKIPRNEE